MKMSAFISFQEVNLVAFELVTVRYFFVFFSTDLQVAVMRQQT